jgi:DNA-binding transcriptional LysR family regulator
VELRHLRYFVAVAETRHFGQAAERLRMAQPPLSQQIRQLEAELGVELFARTTRQVNLTAAGEVFYGDATRILKAVADSTLRVRRFAEGKLGTLRIGFTGSASYRQLPEIARLVKSRMPGVVLDLHTEMLTPAQELALVDRELDAAVLRPPTREDGISWRTIAREPLILALPEHHRLTEQQVVAVGDLRGEGFIMYPASSRSVVNDAIVRSCLAADFYPRVEHEAAKTSTLLSLVAAGLGAALVPESVQGLALEGVVYKPVQNAESVELALAWRTGDESPLLRTFLDVLEENNVFITANSPEDSRENHQNRGDSLRHPVPEAAALRQRRGARGLAHPGQGPQRGRDRRAG